MEKISNFETDKKIAWDAKMAELDTHTDSNGMPLDENVKEAVAGLNLNGIPTFNSCGGHTEKNRLRFPILGGEAPEMPYRYEGEKELRKNVAEKYGIEPHEIDDFISHEDAYEEFWQKIENENIKETGEYIAWHKKNTELEDRVSQLINEFYQEKEKDNVIYLQTHPIHEGYSIHFISDEKLKELENISFDKKCDLINKAQEELRYFSDFLKKRYFSDKF